MRIEYFLKIVLNKKNPSISRDFAGITAFEEIDAVRRIVKLKLKERT